MAAVSDAPAETYWDDYLFPTDDGQGDDAAGDWIPSSAEGFPFYVPTTNDPGPWVFVFVCAISAFLILLLPAMVVWGRQYEAKKKEYKELYAEDEAVFVEDGGADHQLQRQQQQARALLKNDGMANGKKAAASSPAKSDATAPHTTPAKSVADESFDGNGHQASSPEASTARPNPQDLESCMSEESVEVGLDHSITHISPTNSADVNGDGGGNTASDVNSGVGTWREDAASAVNGGGGGGAAAARSNGRDEDDVAERARAQDPPPTAAAASSSRKQDETARSTISGAASAMTTVSRLNRKVGGAFENFADRIFIPHYQDDDPEYKSAVSGVGRTRARTNLSAATTSRLDHQGGGSGRSGTSDIGHRPRIVDAAGRPGAGRRRRRHRRGIGRADMIQRAIESEERSELSSNVGGGMRRWGDNGQTGGAGAGADRSEIQSGVKMSGLANEVMSGMNDEDGRSNLARHQQQQAASRSNNNNVWSVQHGPAQQLRPPRSKFMTPLNRMGGAMSAAGSYARSAVSGAMSETPTVWKNFHEDDITPNDAADADDPGQAKIYIDEEDVDVTVCCGQWALWKPKTVAYGADKVIELAEIDAETKRIVRLGIPLTLSEIVESLFEAITVAILSNFLGTNAVTAYVVADMLVGLTDELVAGIIDAESTICSHAVGAGNNFLAGQYVQIAVVIYVLVSVPFLCMWAFLMDDVIKAFGLNDEIARMGLEYTRVVIFNYLIEGVAASYSTLLDITGHETIGMFVDIGHNVVELAAVVTVVVLNPNTALATIGFIQLVVSVVFFVLMLGWALLKGWLSAFWGGMLGGFALKNTHAVKNVIFTAVPLSLGSFLEYGEWELLTFFAAFLGPAEVASWALLGTIWDLFESCTEGLGEAAAIRVAYHLGKGHPHMARTSSYKSLLLAGFLSLFITSGFFLCGYNLPVWFSRDKTIQHMLADLIPLVGLGNITMTFGMVCWSLVGAQGRFRLATSVSMVSSWFVTIPLGSIFVFGFNINLQGLVASVIVGYSVSGTILSYILLRSDWERLAKIIQELNAMTGEIDSSDSEDEDESSSSSSSSSKSSSSSSDDDSDSESELESGVGSHLSQKHLLS